MTRIDRLHTEATIAALDALSFLVGGGAAADGLRAHRVALRQALDADPAPRECDPYAGPKPGSIADYALRAARSKYVTERLRQVGSVRPPGGPVQILDQQYDADAPKDPT